MARRKQWHLLARAVIAAMCVLSPAGVYTWQGPPTSQQDTYVVTTEESIGEPMTDHQQARYHAFLGESDEAREAYLRAIEDASPAAVPRLWLDLAVLATQHSQWLPARYAYEQAIVTGADNPEVQELATSGLSEQKKARRAGEFGDEFTELLKKVDEQSRVQPDGEDRHEPARKHTRQQRALERQVDRVIPTGTPR